MVGDSGRGAEASGRLARKTINKPTQETFMRTILQIENRLAMASLLGLISTMWAGAAVLNVPAQYPTIQAAVDAAAAGDEIQIAPGVYTEQSIVDRKNLTLTGRPGTVLRAFAG